MYHALSMPLGPWIEDTRNNYSKKKIYLSLFINHVIIVNLSYIRFKVNFTPEKKSMDTAFKQETTNAIYTMPNQM